MKGVVTKIVEKSSDSPVLLLYQTIKRSDKRTTVSTSEGPETKRRKVTVDYGGGKSYFGTEDPPSEVTRKFLVLPNGNTGELKMVEVGEASMLHSAYLTQRDVKAEANDYGGRHSALQKQFGGKRGVRRSEKVEKLRFNTNTNETSLLATINGMEVIEPAVSTKEAMSDSLIAFLPPCHRDATNAHDVYVLSELIGSDVLNAEEPFALSNLQKREKNSALVKSLINPNVKMSASHATGLLFLEALITFINRKVPELQRKQLSASVHIHNKIMDSFCERRGGKHLTRSLQMRDKAIAYCMAIAFVLGGLQFGIDHLVQDINASTRKLNPIMRAIGGVSKGKGSLEYILKLPLPELPSFTGKRNKK